jgi:hypothetical protein
MSENSGDTQVKQIDYSRMTQTSSPKADLDFNTNYGKSISNVDSKMVTPYAFNSLASLHFFTQFAGNKIYKLRVPFISVPSHLAFPYTKYSFDHHGKRETIDIVSRSPMGNLDFPIKKQVV